MEVLPLEIKPQLRQSRILREHRGESTRAGVQAHRVPERQQTRTSFPTISSWLIQDGQ